MSKKPIYEAFESLNQIKSKYLKESKSLKEELWDSARVYDLIKYFYIDKELNIDATRREVIRQMKKEGSVLPKDPKEFDKCFWDDVSEIEQDYDEFEESCKTNKKIVKEALSTADIFERYRLEPRAGYQNNKSWLVAYDTTTDEYVKAEGSKTKYATFKNSKEFIEYIKNLNDDEEVEVETTEQETITEERRPPYSDDEMEKYYDMLDESREYQKELRKLDRGIDISRDENDKFGVNWPARGTQSVEEVEKFVYALDQAAQFCRELNTKYADIL